MSKREQFIVLSSLLNAIFAANRLDDEDKGMYSLIESALENACTKYHMGEMGELITYTANEHAEVGDKAVPVYYKKRLDRMREWMRRNVSSYIDCGEIDVTGLAEAWDFEQGTGDETFDPEHPAWTMATEVATEYEKGLI